MFTSMKKLIYMALCATSVELLVIVELNSFLSASLLWTGRLRESQVNLFESRASLYDGESCRYCGEFCYCGRTSENRYFQNKYRERNQRASDMLVIIRSSNTDNRGSKE